MTKPKVTLVAYEKELPRILITERNPDGVTLNEISVYANTIEKCERVINRLRK